MKNIKLFVTFVASLFFLFSCEKEKVETCGFDTIRLTESFLTEYAKGDGPVISASSTPARRPVRCMAVASMAETVLLQVVRQSSIQQISNGILKMTDG